MKLLTMAIVLCTLFTVAAQDRLCLSELLNGEPVQFISELLSSQGMKNRRPELCSLINTISQHIVHGDFEMAFELVEQAETCGTVSARSQQSNGKQGFLHKIIDPLKKILFNADPATIKATIAAFFPREHKQGFSLPFFKKSLLDAWINTHIILREEAACDDTVENYIHAHPVLMVAHHLALDRIIKTLFIFFCPQSTSCDRMKALFLLNRMHLLGKKGRLFKDFIASSNRHYFSPEGFLLMYDPSSINNSEPHRLHELARFLKKILCKEHYLRYLADALKLGISGLQEIYFHDQQAGWHEPKERSLFKYAKGILKEMTGYDYVHNHSIDQSIIWANKTNKDFVALMTLLEQCDPQSRENTTVLTAAKALIVKQKTEHRLHQCTVVHDMQRYYEDAVRILTRH